eukprot:314310-Chlamydomonas_euryale.AAC.1
MLAEALARPKPSKSDTINTATPRFALRPHEALAVVLWRQSLIAARDVGLLKGRLIQVRAWVACLAH